MNELKPEDVMKALECWVNKKPCEEECPIMEYEGSHNCMMLTMKNALALLREKDARIEQLLGDIRATVELANKGAEEKDAEIEHLKMREKVLTQMLDDGYNEWEDYVRAEAITEFAEMAKRRLPIVSPSVFDKIAKEMRGENDGKSDL